MLNKVFNSFSDLFVYSFSSISCFDFSIFLCDGYKISANGNGLCEVRATATEISRGEPNSSKNFFHFLKLRKKLKNGKVFCGYFLEFFWDFLQPRILQNRCACCTTQIYKNLYKNWIFRKFKYARKKEFYAPIICFG